MQFFKKYGNDSNAPPSMKKLYTFFLIDLRRSHIQSLIYQPYPSQGGVLDVYRWKGPSYRVILKKPLSKEIEEECLKQNIPLNVRLPRFFYFRRLLARLYESSTRRILGLLFIFYLSFFFSKLLVMSYSMTVGNVALSLGPGRELDPVLRETFSRKSQPTIRFSDVIGLEQAKKELMDIIDFFKYPDRYSKTGATVPLGVLLAGSPGTGKTLLAKAFAGEADIPFYAISGAAFDEVYWGVGAERVKTLFDYARKNSPCAIFIDEIDAIGTKRGPGVFSQSLTQLLSEMDGFDPKQPVIVFAATNRDNVLDPALMRPGRFDRIIKTSMPNSEERRAIFNYYVKKNKMPLSDLVDFSRWTRRTTFMSPADIESLLNEAGLHALREHKKMIDESDFEEAFVRITRGHRTEKSSSEAFREKKALLSAAETLVAWQFFKESHTRPIRSTILPEEQATVGVLLEPFDYDNYGQPTPEYFKNHLKLLCTESVVSGRYKPIKLYTSLFDKGVQSPKFCSPRPIRATKNLIIKTLFGYGFCPEFGDSNPELQYFCSGDWPCNRGSKAVGLSKLPEGLLAKIEKNTSDLLAQAQEEVYGLLCKKSAVVLALKALLLERETLNQQELIDFFAGFGL